MKIVFYQTSDLHGYVYPTDYVHDKPLGLLTIGSFLLEDEQHYDASLKIDCGDMIQGSAFANYLYQTRPTPHPLTELLKAIGYDVYVVGNHEFNYGLDYVDHVYHELQERVLNANIEGLPFPSKPYQIFDFDGFRIACIGLTTAYIPNWEHPHHIAGLNFKDPVEQYAAYEKELQAQADYIVVCYHGGFEDSLNDAMTPTEPHTQENQGSELLKRFSSIDVILSGHQHRGFCTSIRDVICAQPLHNGQSFTKLVIDTQTKTTTWELIETASLPIIAHPKLEGIVHQTQSALSTWLQETIGHLTQDMILDDVFKARLYGHPLICFIHEVQLHVSQADLSITNLFDSAIGFHKQVSTRDVLVNFPYPNTLRVLQLSGHMIKQQIEKSATYFILENDQPTINPTFLKPKVQNYNYDMFGGLEYEIDLRRSFGERVTNLTYQGRDMDLNRMYEVVMSNYRANDIKHHPDYQHVTQVKEIETDISELIITYLQEHDMIQPNEECAFHVLW